MKDIRLDTGDVWFFSDPHFYHRNLCVGTSRWPDKLRKEGRDEEAELMIQNGLRKFDNDGEMNEVLLKSINDRITEDSVVFCLGDWCFGGTSKIVEMRNRIKARELHLVLGNHDKDIRNKIELQSIFSSVSDLVNLYVLNKHIVLSHYSMRVWEKSHRGTVHLYGHSHGNLPQHVDKDGNPYKTMDVGFDALYNEFGEYRPISYREVMDIMDNRVETKIDHHKR